VFDACAAAQARGNELYIQITCQPLSFDFTLASAYPFYSHPAFDPIKAYDREQLKTVFCDPSFRDAFRADLRNPKPGTVFQGTWGARHCRRAGKARECRFGRPHDRRHCARSGARPA